MTTNSDQRSMGMDCELDLEAIKKQKIIDDYKEKIKTIHRCKNKTKHSLNRIGKEIHCMICCDILNNTRTLQLNNYSYFDFRSKNFSCSKECEKQIVKSSVTPCRICEIDDHCKCKCVTCLKMILEMHDFSNCEKIKIVGSHNCEKSGLNFIFKY